MLGEVSIILSQMIPKLPRIIMPGRFFRLML